MEKFTVKIKEELEKLKSVDIYSLIMFAMFKLKDIPEYSTLSELVYILDKNNLLKLCEYFGGLTIQIPTIEDLEYIVYGLLVYQYVNIDNIEYEKAMKQISTRAKDLKKVKHTYNKLVEILNEYNFSRT